MTDQTHQDTGRIDLGGAKGLFVIRLATGLIQGLILYLLYLAADAKVWPQTQPALFGALTLAAGYAPAVVLAGVGRIKPLALILWTLIAAAALALLGAHDVARQVLEDHDRAPFLTFPVMAFGAAALFIAHHLIVPALRERRWIAPYPDYFDVAWKAGVQLALSLGFTGAFWLLLHLGAALFKMIGLAFLQDILREEWFSIPVSTLVFAVAVQLTDVRDGLIRGVRTVALMLLSWLLLVITVLVAGFLAALPFTGLDGLWNTRSATALVLAAAAALIVLINTAYQDGRADNLPPVVLRYAVRVASILIAPLIGLAFWGLGLRIGQHGLTPDRIIAAACALVGAVYGLGYLLAAVKPGGWMKPLERTNVIAAVLSVLVILALFSPLADPARLSVGDQVARLERGAVSTADFDYDFLRFESGKAGAARLKALTHSRNPQIAQLAREAQAKTSRYSMDLTDPVTAAATAQKVRLKAAPGQPAPPASFTAQLGRLEPVLRDCANETPCWTRTLDLNGDGRKDLLVSGRSVIMAFILEADGRWFEHGRYHSNCPTTEKTLADAFLSGEIQIQPARLPDLILNGEPLQAELSSGCPSTPRR